jgi:hypothetical protein
MHGGQFAHLRRAGGGAGREHEVQQHHLALHGGRRQWLALLVDQLQALQRGHLCVGTEGDEQGRNEGCPSCRPHDRTEGV